MTIIAGLSDKKLSYILQFFYGCHGTEPGFGPGSVGCYGIEPGPL